MMGCDRPHRLSRTGKQPSTTYMAALSQNIIMADPLDVASLLRHRAKRAISV
jgi:hypothetical protein